MSPRTEHFLIHCTLRNPASGRGDAVDGIADEGILREYSQALEDAYNRLPSDAGWTTLGRRDIEVRIRMIDDDSDGVAVYGDGETLPSIELKNLGNEPNGVCARERRSSTAVHELTHLHQFAYPHAITWSWQWFAEASATAMEIVLRPNGSSYFMFQRPWVCYPEVSIDDSPGYQSALFVYYLLTTCGNDFAARTYEAGTPTGERRPTAIETVAEMVNKWAAKKSAKNFEEVFAYGYCPAAYFLRDPASVLHLPALAERLGDRAVTESFDAYPLDAESVADVVSHLGCRYFRFRPIPGKSLLTIKVTPNDPGHLAHLRAVIHGSDANSRSTQQVRLSPSAEPLALSAQLEGFSSDALDCAVLIVTNVAYGAGAPDDLAFTLDATVT